MTPKGLRRASDALLCMGIGAAMTLFLGVTWPTGAWTLALALIAVGFMLDLVAEAIMRRNERDVKRIRDEHR